MTGTNPQTPATESRLPHEPRWGMGDAIAGWFGTYAFNTLVTGIIFAVFGYTGTKAKMANLPLSMVLASFPSLWLGFIGVPYVVCRIKGNGWVEDLKLKIKPSDIPIGLAIGVLTQIPLVAIVSFPWVKLLGEDMSTLQDRANELADKVNSAPGAILFFIFVAILAPICEEIFFRGLVLRSIEKTWGTALAVVLSSVAFGLTHFQVLQLPALVMAGAVFAGLAVWKNRLAIAIAAHVGFNAVTVISVLAAS